MIKPYSNTLILQAWFANGRGTPPTGNAICRNGGADLLEEEDGTREIIIFLSCSVLPIPGILRFLTLALAKQKGPQYL